MAMCARWMRNRMLSTRVHVSKNEMSSVYDAKFIEMLAAEIFVNVCRCFLEDEDLFQPPGGSPAVVEGAVII